MYLLDTNIVSELRRQKSHSAVVAWLSALSEDNVYLSTVTIGELQAGVEKARSRDAAKAREIDAWLNQISEAYHVLPMDVRVFRCWGRLMQDMQGALAMDAMIAATALMHKLTVVTRNIDDFQCFSVGTLNSFETT